MKNITVKAHPNIALIKYWGKRNETLLLPTKSSLSVSLEALTTTTTISFSKRAQDVITINGEQPRKTTLENIHNFLNLIRQQSKSESLFEINSHNNFPTAAGLASSASGFAAIALGLNRLLNLNVSSQQLSILARQGSGSASRSIFGGFVLWHKGTNHDGSDSFAEQLFSEKHWPEFKVIVVITSTMEKKISSRKGMQETINASKNYKSWLEKSADRIEKIHDALKNKNFSLVGKLAQADCLDMHATMHECTPPIDYLSPITHTVMNMINELRVKKNIESYFTIDAGPNVKVLCLENIVPVILKHLKTVPGVEACIVSAVASNPEILETE